MDGVTDHARDHADPADAGHDDTGHDDAGHDDCDHDDRAGHAGELVVDCRLRAATELFAHTWDPVVLIGLRTGPRRRHALRAAIGGISDKALTEALHRLQDSGLVERAAVPQAPPRVEYRLSRLGRSLVDGPMRALGDWITEHGAELLDAQEAATG